MYDVRSTMYEKYNPAEQLAGFLFLVRVKGNLPLKSATNPAIITDLKQP
jgi:hypothetical protein